MGNIHIWYVDTASPDYRDWQLDHDAQYLICIDCHRLVRRESEYQHRCKDCHNKKPNIRRRKRNRKLRRQRSENKNKLAGGFKSPSSWLKHQAKICAWCGQDCDDTATVDHVVPLWQGGAHHPSNYQVLCSACHELKTTGEQFWLNERESHTRI